MSIFAAQGFYNQGDQNIFNQDNRFFGERKYRLGDPVYKNIGFNSSMQNASGIMGLPQPILPIKQGGGEGGGGITDAPDTSGFDYETEAYGIDPAQGLTDEEQDALDAYGNPSIGMKGYGTIAGMLAGIVNPITGIVSLAYQRNKAKEAAAEAAATAEAIGRDNAAGAKSGQAGSGTGGIDAAGS